ncbi:type II toxin-antitoxin system RelE/ParE family toxin [Gloeocapsa sp. PCC 73106]|uniref:type II toxin-antitoxin system RelE/ParE family toxin n=1 Tax=Gloeocapsa sp. PCC 73106 TaxID=102232 RepID=UPI0002AD114A|nr:type II toxin-antitoxin system RelE/ParE family toxin [Gloeocapsa sp. PCC 73106]ELR99859.1 putative addiction module killer protein [Gloeocapsa sp. PCC 73106]
MDEKLWEIKKYVTETGVCPFDEWFETLADITQARIDVRLDRISLGNFGDHKNIGDGVYELRFFFGSGYRIYYGIAGRRVVLLLTGGDKSSQNRDIRIAQRFWYDYQKETGDR